MEKWRKEKVREGDEEVNHTINKICINNWINKLRKWMNEWMLLEGIILWSEADIASAQSASGSTALLTLLRLSLYPILAYLSGLVIFLVFPHAKCLAAVLLQGYQSCPQEDRFPFSSPHTRHFKSTFRKNQCPDSLCWGFGFKLHLKNGIIHDLRILGNFLDSIFCSAIHLLLPDFW